MERRIKASGAKHWDLYGQEAEIGEAHLRGLDIESLRIPIRNWGYSIRIFKQMEKVGIGLASGSSLDTNKIDEVVGLAEHISRSIKVPAYTLPLPSKYSSVKISDPKITKNPEEVVMASVERVRNGLKDAGIELTFGKIRTYCIKTRLVSSAGIDAEKEETQMHIELALKASKGSRAAEYWGRKTVRSISQLHIEEDLRKWIKLAKDTLRAKAPKTGITTLILPPSLVAEAIVDVVGFHSSGLALYEKLSQFEKGTRLAGNNVTLEDDGTYDYGLGTSPFDDEGTPQKKTVLINRGICEGFLFDQMYGAITKEKSTGNGLKGGFSLDKDTSYAYPISIHTTNLKFKEGDMKMEELIGNVKNGILVANFSWLLPNEVTGSFGSEIRNGYLIKKGELSTPIKGGQVSGQLLDVPIKQGGVVKGLLSRISGMGKRLEMAGNCIAPYMRFEDVQVAGT